MKVAVFPQRKCREPIEIGEFIMANCDVREGHPGPCGTLSNQASRERRERWEAEHPDWEDQMNEKDIIL